MRHSVLRGFESPQSAGIFLGGGGEKIEERNGRSARVCRFVKRSSHASPMGARSARIFASAELDLHGTDDAHVAYMPVYTIRKRIFHK